MGRELAPQQHVVQHGEVGQQVQLLEDDADVVGAKAVAPGAGQRTQIRPIHLDAAVRRGQHASQQAQQRALAAAAGAGDEDVLASAHLEMVHPQVRALLARPGEGDVAERSHGLRGVWECHEVRGTSKGAADINATRLQWRGA
ncbi:hypothetical protein D3C87_1314600 [compost metagenome]